MRSESIEYHAEGQRFSGYFAVDDKRSGKRPGVLIGPEASGLNDINKDRARQLAELGYAAFAIDFVGDGKVLSDMQASMALVTRFRETPEAIRTITLAALAALRARAEVDASKIAAIGYCFGGTAVLELARSGADVACTVGFHSALATKRPEDAKHIKGKVLACIGADDPIVPAEQRAAFEQEMRAAKVDWRLYVMGGQVHGFMNPAADSFKHPALAYSKSTHERSWHAMRQLFDETFGAP
jgi:dienelactone hydrolase